MSQTNSENYGILGPGTNLGSINKSVAIMAQYDLEVQREWNETQQDFAKAYMGLSADGKTLDINNGIVGKYVEAADSAATEAGAAIENDAISAAITAGVGMVGVLGMASNWAMNRTGDLSAQKENLTTMRGRLNESAAGADPVADVNLRGGAAAAQEFDTEALRGDPQVTGQVEQWQNGNFDNYQSKGTPELQRKAMQLAKADDETRAAISAKLDQRINEVQSQIDQRLGTEASRNQLVGIFCGQYGNGGGIGGSIGSAVENFEKAQHTTNSQEAQAAAETEKTAQQQFLDNINTSKQNANQAAQAATQDWEQYRTLQVIHA